jgi:hypothetical protein
MFNFYKTVFLAAAFSISFFSQPAWSDYEVMHGSICHHRNPDDKDFISFVSGAVANRDTAKTRQISCPLAGGHEFRYNPEKMYIDHISTVSFFCVLKHYRTFRLVQSIGATIPAAPAGAATPFPNVSILNPDALSSFELTCNLPPNNAAKIVAIETIF